MPLLALSLLVVVAAVERTVPHQEQPLVKIVSEPQDEREHEISLRIEPDGQIREVIRRSSSGQTVIPVEALLRGPVPLAGHDALLASCPGCDPLTGGQLTLQYLHNGVTRRYASTVVRLERRGNAFRLATLQGEPIRRLRLTARRLLGVLVGIGEIVVE